MNVCVCVLQVKEYVTAVSVSVMVTTLAQRVSVPQRRMSVLVNTGSCVADMVVVSVTAVSVTPTSWEKTAPRSLTPAKNISKCKLFNNYFKFLLHVLNLNQQHTKHCTVSHLNTFSFSTRR